MDRIEFITDSKLRRKVVLKFSVSVQKEYSLLKSLDSERIIRPIEMRDDCIVFPEYPERAADGIAGYCSEKEAWRFIKDVAEGLDYIHNKNIIHGDIKPSNVLISESGYVINDFDMEGDLSSYAFTPPEWSKDGKNVTEKSDVWSLGASVFYLLNGTFIFNGRGAVLQKEDTKIPSLRKDVYTKDLSDVVSKCLSYNPQERPAPKDLFIIAERMIEKKYQKKPKKDTLNNNCSYIHDDIWPEEMI